jgi:hypothetical protein
MIALEETQYAKHTETNTMTDDTLMIVQLHLRRLRDRQVILTQEQVHDVVHIFTLSSTDMQPKRHMVTGVASLESIFGRTVDINVIHALMLCITPRRTLELFPALQENIWSVTPTRRSWRTREAIKLSNDLASSGLMFCIDIIPRPMLYTALVYFALNHTLHTNKRAIESMNHTLNTDAGMFAEFIALSSVTPPYNLTNEMQACIDAVMGRSHAADADSADFMRVSIVPFTVLFDSEPSSDSRICAYDVITNICAAVGITLPQHIQSKTSFGARRLVYFPRFSCVIANPAIDLCIPLGGGTIAVLNSSLFWAPAAALMKGFQMTASPVSAQLSIESTFTPATSLKYPLYVILRFYTVYIDHALGLSDEIIESGEKALMNFLSSLDNDDLYLNKHSENGILSIFCLLMDQADEGNIPEDMIIAVLAYMHTSNPDLDDLMQRIGRLPPDAQYAPSMPLGALIVEYAGAPQYVDPCLWACMGLFSVNTPPPPPQPPVMDIFTALFEESKAAIHDFSLWSFEPAAAPTHPPHESLIFTGDDMIDNKDDDFI